jgi:hypothetical protein
LRDRLAFHRIATIGRGRSARLTVEDLQLFEAKEREWPHALPSRDTAQQRHLDRPGIGPRAKRSTQL